MTTEECVRKLAEKMEPFDSLGDPETDQRYELSPKGFWMTDLVKSERTGFMVRGWVHNPLTSADASERLLEAMPEPTLKRDHYSNTWMCYASPSYSMIRCANRRVAIFLAALAWKGLEKPEDLK